MFSITLLYTQYTHSVEEGYRREGKGRRWCLGVGPEMIQFLAALAILHQYDLRERMNRITAPMRNRCFEKMDDQPVHTMHTKPQPSQNGCSAKNLSSNHPFC